MNLDNFKVMLCPSLETAKEFNPEATVEAEYGDICVEGSKVTLAHHGSRSENPAPCNADVEPLESGTIVVSHLDLDTIGGIMAIVGDKIDDPEFWAAAEHIDVNGPHHVHEFPQDIQDKLNAIWAWNAEQPRVRYTEPTDVTEQVKANYGILEKVLDEAHPQHNDVIQKGREWEERTTNEVESKLVDDYAKMRVFKTDGVFCAGSYYSPNQEMVVPATITFNEKFKSITIAFENGGKDVSAKDIVQQIWGPEAGGRDGIAGSPRGQEMTDRDFEKAQIGLACMLSMNELTQNVENIIEQMTKEELSTEYTSMVFEKYGNEYFKEYDDDCDIRFEFTRDPSQSVNLEDNPYSDKFLVDIIGMETHILGPDFYLTMRYMFNDDEKSRFMNACEEQDKSIDDMLAEASNDEEEMDI